jgi:EmrB/QacA subfamily drug resistance transporter
MNMPRHHSAIPRKWLCFASIALGTFMSYVDANIINIALPTMARDFQADLSAIKWVVTSYLLMVTGLVLVFGRVADLYGRKRLYLLGFAVFTLGSALCSVAPTIWSLVAFRCVQGIGAAALLANGAALLTESFPAEERSRALGMAGSVIALAAIAGPLLGGLLAEHLGWRSVFYVNLPIGVIGSLLAARVLPARAGLSHRERFDFWGALTLVAGLSCSLFLTSALSQPDRSGPVFIALLGATAVLLGCFVAIESRVRHPLLDLSLFRQRAFSAAIASSFLSFWALSALSFLLPFYLDRVLGLSPSQVGSVFAPVPLVLAVVAPLGGHLADRFGSRTICTLGALINCLGLIGLSRLGTETSALGVILGLIPFGIGSGLFHPPNNSAIMGAVPKSRLGVASGMISAIKSLGSLSGVAVTSLIFSVAQQAALERLQALGKRDGTLLSVSGAPAGRQSFASAVSLMFLISAAICAVVVVTSLIRGGKPAEGEQEAMAVAEV